MADSNDKKTTTRKTKVTATPAAKSSVQKAAVTASASAASSLPTADALKERFKAGSIPLQTDFAELIDMADAGAQAAGKASGQSGAGLGMRISSTGQLEPDIGHYNFKNDTQGCSAIKVDTENNSLVVDLYYGLADYDSGLGVKAGKYIKVDSDGVSVDLQAVLPKGMITMFSGSAAPDGWALCDGSNGTPDLRDRFIVGKGTKFTSDGEGTTKTKSTTSTGSVTVNPHALTESEIPEHNHATSLYDFGYAIGDRNGVFAYRPNSHSGANGATSYCGKAGDGKEHSHTASVIMNGHTHDIDVVPPYFALAFIMKL